MPRLSIRQGRASTLIEGAATPRGQRDGSRRVILRYRHHTARVDITAKMTFAMRETCIMPRALLPHGDYTARAT